MPLSPITAIGFDLGDTLFEYEGMPLSWVAHYDDALKALAQHLGAYPTAEQLARGADVLRRFNTRLNPRAEEVPFRQILDELATVFGAPASTDEVSAARPFFSVFRQRLRAFPDALPTLAQLRARGLRIGCFTDVPYGMPNELVAEDIAGAGLSGAVDVLLTSRDAGFRKPATATLAALASALGATPETLVYVGNEEKDIAVARAYGCQSVLLDRAAANPAWGQTLTIRTLSELTLP